MPGLCPTQKGIEGKGDQREDQQTHEVELQAGFQQTGQLLFPHEDQLPSAAEAASDWIIANYNIEKRN